MMTREEKLEICMEVFNLEDLLEELFSIVKDDPEVEEWLNKTWFDSSEELPEKMDLMTLYERNTK
jgi:hypothetical protein